MIVAVEAERVRRGQAQLAEALPAVDVVGVGWDQQAPRLELDAVARAQRKGGPLCTDQRRSRQNLENRRWESQQEGARTPTYPSNMDTTQEPVELSLKTNLV